MLAAAKERGGRALVFVIVVTAIDINNVGVTTIDIGIDLNNGAGITTIDIGINFNKGASTCISHAGADVTSPPRRFRKNLYHEIREARRARASTEDLCPPQSRAAIGPFFDRRWIVVKLSPVLRSAGNCGVSDA